MRIISNQAEAKPVVTQAQLCLYNKGKMQYSRENCGKKYIRTLSITLCQRKMRPCATRFLRKTFG